MATETCVVPFLYEGRWVARCPLCGNTEMAGRADDGAAGGLGQSVFTCVPGDPDAPIMGVILPRRGCGLRCPVEWSPLIAEIEALTAARPRVFRNWFPGEDLHDLVLENLAHGIVPTAALEGRGGLALSIVGDDITAGALESAARPELERT